MKTTPLLALCWFLAALGPVASQDEGRPPNVILIVADDLGYGELGSYGQEKIRTPHLDRLAAEGLRFRRFYAGAPVCAPSRCVLMTGRSLARAPIRGNREVKPEGQFALPRAYPTLGDLFSDAGYATCAIGKWGLGSPGSEGEPTARGFDHFFGYNCQRQAHNYYPQWLWDDRERLQLSNPPFRAHQKAKGAFEDHARWRGREYAPVLMMQRAEAFLRENRARPFFLYLPLVEPHLALQTPDARVEAYPRSWDASPYPGGRGYLPHLRPRAAYAGLISDLDGHVGRILGLLDELALSEDTLVLFTSDNGPTHDVGGVDTTFFASSGGLRGRKGSVYEGGLRVPLIARWKGRIAAGEVSDHIAAFQDFFPTFADLLERDAPPTTDGVSFLPTLLGRGLQAEHGALCWEFYGYGGQQAVLAWPWKLVRKRLRRKNRGEWELYELSADPAETRDLASEKPEIVARLSALMGRTRTSAPGFEIEGL